MRILSKRTATSLCAATPLLLWGDVVLAHPGQLIADTSINSFLTGLLHPLTGVDHLVAILAVGIWSALTHRSGRPAAQVAASFLVFLFIGAILGMNGMHWPGFETGIIASVLVLGLLVASCTELPRVLSIGLIGVFAVLHGLAHGVELPVGAVAGLYVSGFMITTMALLLGGLLAGFYLTRYSNWAPRLLGTGIASYGAILFLSL